MITYAADSHQLYGDLVHYPAADHPEGEMIDVVEWDTGKPLGQIKQVPHTYNVIGNMNEFQVAIGETTFGGREELVSTNGVIDYGSLIYLTLQRSKSAQEAIKTMTDLVAEYGYVSSGESFSIMDKNEVWMLEMVGKGEEKGAVWVAQRIPDGTIAAHANQARITKIDFNDSQNFKYSEDVYDFAVKKGYFKGDKKDFSFSDTYEPVTFATTRGCDTRVYAFFSDMLGDDNVKQYYSYALGNITYDENGNANNRMPLYMEVPADKKISVKQVMNAMKNHFEGLSISLLDAPGAGPYYSPYRWRPMDFTVDGVAYTNERSVATQQTAWSFVAQGRSDYADPVGGIFWFGVDDTAQTVYVPFFCGHNNVPEYYKRGNGDLLTYSPTSMFWLTTRVANHAYLRYNEVIKDINIAQDELEDYFINEINTVIYPTANEINKADGSKATVTYLTSISNQFAEKAFKRYQTLETYLLVKYIDGNTKKVDKNGKFLRDEYNHVPMPDMFGYPQWYYDSIVQATGDLHKKHLEFEPPKVCKLAARKGF